MSRSLYFRIIPQLTFSHDLYLHFPPRLFSYYVYFLSTSIFLVRSFSKYVHFPSTFILPLSKFSPYVHFPPTFVFPLRSFFPMFIFPLRSLIHYVHFPTLFLEIFPIRTFSRSVHFPTNYIFLPRTFPCQAHCLATTYMVMRKLSRNKCSFVYFFF